MAKGSNYPNENVFNKKKIYWILSKFAWFINHKWHLNLTVLEKKSCFQKKNVLHNPLRKESTKW